MSEQLVETASESISQLVHLPDGQVLDLANASDVAKAYDDMQHLKRMLREVEGKLKEALVAHSSDVGKKTFEVDGAKVEIKGGKETRYDAQAIKRALKAAGMPEDRIKEIVRETIEYKVSAVEAKKAATANEKYAQIIKEHSTVEEKTPSVSVKKIGGKAVLHTPLAPPAGIAETTAEALPAPADAPSEEDMPW